MPTVLRKGVKLHSGVTLLGNDWLPSHETGVALHYNSRHPNVDYRVGTSQDLRAILRVPDQGGMKALFQQTSTANQPFNTRFREGLAAYFEGSMRLTSSLAAASYTFLHDGVSKFRAFGVFRIWDVAASSHTILRTLASFNFAGVLLQINSAGRIIYQVGNASGSASLTIQSGDGFIEDGGLYIWEIEKDGTAVTLRVNASVVGSGSITAPSAEAPGHSLVIGNTNGGSHDFRGWLPEIFIVEGDTNFATQANKYLSRWKLEAQSPVEIFGSDLESWWRDEYELDGSDNVTQWTDLTGNGHHLIKVDGDNSVPLRAASSDFGGHDAIGIGETTSSRLRADSLSVIASGVMKPWAILTWGLGNQIETTTRGVMGFADAVEGNAEHGILLQADTGNWFHTRRNDADEIAQRNHGAEDGDGLLGFAFRQDGITTVWAGRDFENNIEIAGSVDRDSPTTFARFGLGARWINASANSQSTMKRDYAEMVAIDRAVGLGDVRAYQDYCRRRYGEPWLEE